MATDAPVRVRFAPSPTGYLHTGGARTALFNWLWARHSGGSFVLRIEDTDEQRSTEASTRAILDSLLWLGIDWDEGPDPDPARFGQSLGPHSPYFQSQREDLHVKAAERLLIEGRAFYCPATEEEMTGPDGKKLLFSPYRDLPPDEQREAFMRAMAGGRGLPIRFRCPRELDVAWEDVIRGPVSFQSDEIGDFVIWKSTGQALYNFACVCDDHDMEITHVLRGEDHISNTPKQCLLYDALGWARPVFGHVPLIVGMDRARLSKRHGATRVEAYRAMGVLPEALANFLLLIGWAPSGHSAVANQELFSHKERRGWLFPPGAEDMREHFSPSGIGRSAGAFNIEKLNHFNGLYIRALSPGEFFERLKPYLPPGWLEYRGKDYARAALVLYHDKLTTLSEIAQNAWYFFVAPKEAPEYAGAAAEATADAAGSGGEEGGAPGYGYYDAKSLAKHVTSNADAPRVLGGLYKRLAQTPAAQWTQAGLEPAVEQFCCETGLGKGKVMQPWRVALTGGVVSPGFYDLLGVLGKEETLRRAAPWVERLRGAKLE
jgi:glutamyl-tRNA synthetase